ncbi:MAG: RNA-guided endonuclease InsQ/TnpB family protein [Pyrinomonadaceae bacterium]
MAENSITKSFKFRIFPSKTQSQKLEQTLFLCRDLYNAALAERKQAYQLNRISLNYYDQANQLSEIKSTNPEYKDVHSQVCQDVLKRLDKSFQSFFRRVKQGVKAGFPRFKGKNFFDSFCHTQSGFSLSGNKLTLSKIGTVKIKLSREIVGKVKQCRIKKEIDKWFVIFTVETVIERLPKTGKEIGIDVGIENFCNLSDGTQIDNWKYYEQSNKKLRISQRSVSRKRQGSNSRRKAVLKLRKIHQKIKNQRADFQHKLSTHLVKEFDLIAIEKLNILGLSKGILSKQIHDVSWSSFFEMIRYKAENAGRELKEVNPNYTSQTCLCGNREKKTLSQRWHNCVQCGLSIHRDILSAKIILLLGQSGKDIKWAVAPCLSLESPPANRFGLGGECQFTSF